MTVCVAPRIRNDIVLANHKLVYAIAHKISPSHPQIDFDDLVSAGTIGLIKAVERHDASKAKLSTFAYPYIYGEIQREIRDKWQVIRISRSHYDVKNKLRKLDEQGLDEQAIALKLKVSDSELANIRQSLGLLRSPPKELSEFLKESNEYQVTSNEADSALLVTRYSLLKKDSPRLKEVFETICYLGRTTTTAIALHLGISQGRVRDYTGQLRKRGAIIKDGFWYQANLERVVIQGIKKQVEQKIEIANFLSKLEELINLKTKVVKLEEDLKAIGGDRTTWILEQLQPKKENRN